MRLSALSASRVKPICILHPAFQTVSRRKGLDAACSSPSEHRRNIANGSGCQRARGLTINADIAWSLSAFSFPYLISFRLILSTHSMALGPNCRTPGGLSRLRIRHSSRSSVWTYESRLLKLCQPGTMYSVQAFLFPSHYFPRTSSIHVWVC